MIQIMASQFLHNFHGQKSHRSFSLDPNPAQEWRRLTAQGLLPTAPSGAAAGLLVMELGAWLVIMMLIYVSNIIIYT